jgi:hypothetical protein
MSFVGIKKNPPGGRGVARGVRRKYHWIAMSMMDKV